MDNERQETIADIVAEMRKESHAGDESCLEWVGEKMRNYAYRIETAAKRERDIAAKDAEIAQIKACLNGDCNRFRLGAEPCPGCHIQTNIAKIDSLKSLVKELTDTLQKHFRCSGYCDGCMLTKLKYECKTKSDYELVRKALEVLNG